MSMLPKEQAFKQTAHTLSQPKPYTFFPFPLSQLVFFLEPLGTAWVEKTHDLGRGHAVRLRAAPADEDVLLASLGAMAAGKPRKLRPCMSQQGETAPMLARKGT